MSRKYTRTMSLTKNSVFSIIAIIVLVLILVAVGVAVYKHCMMPKGPLDVGDTGASGEPMVSISE